MKTTLELTTDQKIQLQRDMGVVADELLFSLVSEVGNDNESLKLRDDMLIVMGKQWTISGGQRL